MLAVALVFGQTARHEFVDLDDGDYVYENPHVLGGLTGKGVRWAITACDYFNWHPLTWLSHIIDYELYGRKPAGHHLTNVFLHAAAAVVLFLALRRSTAALWPSAWAAAVFAVHPLRAESVAWVAERKDVLSGLFFALTLWAYARYAGSSGGRGDTGTRRRGEWGSWGWYGMVVGFFALGLTAKPMLVTLPFVLLLLDYWPLGRWKGAGSGENTGRSLADGSAQGSSQPPSGARSQVFSSCSPFSAPRSLLLLLTEKIPLFVLAAASCVVTLVAQRGALLPVAFSRRVANAAVAYCAYLGKMLCPIDLAIYPLPETSPPVGKVVAAIVLLLAISTAAFVVRRKCPYLLVGWLWYLGTLVPVIGFVQVGYQEMADRYSYLTQIGLYLAMACGAAHVARYWPYRCWPLAVAAALVLAGFIGCAWRQAWYWHDSVTLWTHTLACTSQNPAAHNNLGSALARTGRNDEAQVQYRKALEIKPAYAEAHNGLGNALAVSGQVEEAMVQYRKALDIKPAYTEAHNGLGVALLACGQVDEAILQFRMALEASADNAKAHNNLGKALAARGQIDEALVHFRKALSLALARNDRALVDSIRARIRLLEPAGSR